MRTNEPVVQYDENSWSLAFYLKPNLIFWNDIETKKQQAPYLVYTKKENMPKLMQQAGRVIILKEFGGFHISQLNGNFINYKTREQTLTEYIVARVTP